MTDFSRLDPQAAAGRGFAQTNAMLESFAKVRAGRALARGDVQGAQDTLNNEGMIDQANTVQANDWTQQDRVRKLAVEHQVESAKFTADVTASLYRLRQAHAQDADQGNGAVLAGFDQLVPVFRQRGLSDQELNTFRTQLAKDPEQFLMLMHDNSVKHYVQLKGSAGQPDTLVNADTGEHLASGATGPVYHNVAPGGTLVQTPYAGSAPQPTRATPPPPPPADAAPVTPEQSAAAAAEVASAAPQPAVAPTAAPAEPDTPWALPQKTVSSILGAPITVARHGFTRTAAENVAAGGVPNSEHVARAGELMGHALDFNVQGRGHEGHREAMQQIVDSGVPFNQLIDEGDHIHVSWGPEMKHEVLVGSKARGYRRINMAPSAGGAGRDAAAAAPTTLPDGSKVIFSSPPKAPPKTADWTPPRRAAAGDPTFREGTVYKVNKANGDTVVIQAPPTVSATGPGAKHNMTPAEEKTLFDLRKSGRERQAVLADVDRFVNYLSGPHAVRTGGMMGAPGVATAMGPFNTAIGDMRSIINKLTPVMRQGLPGAASDKDVAMFRGSTVGFDKTPEANRRIAASIKAMAQREGDYLAFLEAWALRHNTLKGSQEVWSAYSDANPLYTNVNGVARVNKVRPWREQIRLDDSDPAPAPSAAPASRGGTWTPEKGFVRH